MEYSELTTSVAREDNTPLPYASKGVVSSIGTSFPDDESTLISSSTKNRTLCTKRETGGKPATLEARLAAPAFLMSTAGYLDAGLTYVMSERYGFMTYEGNPYIHAVAAVIGDTSAALFAPKILMGIFAIATAYVIERGKEQKKTAQKYVSGKHLLYGAAVYWFIAGFGSNLYQYIKNIP